MGQFHAVFDTRREYQRLYKDVHRVGYADADAVFDAKCAARGN